jgi:L-malate glycosyltransferase
MINPLNIVSIFYARPHLGGSGIMSMEVSKELSRRGHRVQVVSYPGTYLSPEEAETGVSIHPVDAVDYDCFKAEPFLETFSSLISSLHTDEQPIDVIHAHYAVTHGGAAILARDMIARRGGNAKVVITNHGSDIHTNGHHALLGPYLEYALSNADATTFVSGALQDEARELFNLSHYGEVVYNFVDPERFQPMGGEAKGRLRSELGIPQSSLVLYHASNFRDVKNTPLLIDVASELKRLGINSVYFLLVGDGPDRTELEQKTTRLGIEEMVQFAGRQNDVVPYICASDITLLCSKREGLPLSLLEGMSAGLAAIGTEVGGIPELITPRKDGYLFEPGNNNALISLIARLEGERSQVATMGEEARKTVLTRFSRDSIVDQYEALYQRIRTR